MRETTDILISGGGVAGLAAACAFGAAGFRVICVEPNPPVTKGEAEGSDLRTTAFLHPSIPVLDRAGLWARLAPHAAALQVMRIVDAGGVVPEPRVIKDFDAADLSDKPFGWNLPNWLLRREMLARMAELHARGELDLNVPFVNESFIGTEFTGTLVAETRVGDRPAVVPTITGRAWVTGLGQYLLDPDDPFPEGFVF